MFVIEKMFEFLQEFQSNKKINIFQYLKNFHTDCLIPIRKEEIACFLNKTSND